MKASDFEAARNLIKAAMDRVKCVEVLDERLFATLAPRMIFDSSASIACSSLRVRGIAIESNTDPHQELCERLAKEFPGEAHQLMVEIGQIDAVTPSLEHAELVRRAIDYIEAMLPCLAGVVAESDAAHFRESLNHVWARLPRYPPDDGAISDADHQRITDFLGETWKDAKEINSFFGPGRDSARIEQILARVAQVWKRYPDLRLGQLLLAVTGDIPPPSSMSRMKKLSGPSSSNFRRAEGSPMSNPGLAIEIRWRDAPSCKEQPEGEMSQWSFIEFAPGDIVLLGTLAATGRTRVTSAIVGIEASGRTVTTSSGRRYRLVGPPGMSDVSRASFRALVAEHDSGRDITDALCIANGLEMQP